MPIAHQQNANYAAFTNMYALGRPYRQPLTGDANAAQAAPGLEIFISQGAAGDLFAMFDGNLTCRPATAQAAADQLILEIASTVILGEDNFVDFKILEAPPAQIVYENVDRAEVQTAIDALLTTAFAACNGPPSNWPACMSMFIQVNGANWRVRNYINAAGPNTAQRITALATGFATGAANALLRRITVDVGTRLGRAGAYLNGDPAPPGPLPAGFVLGAAADSNRARRLTLCTMDRGGQHVNPLYYLHFLMRRAVVVPPPQPAATSLTTIVNNMGNLAHPLVDLYPAIAQTAAPLARLQVGQYWAFPIAPLGGWHRFGSATLRWRYANNSLFEVQGGQPSMAPTNNHRRKVRLVWDQWGAQMRTISRVFQVPAEVIVALICNESWPDVTPRVARLEPLSGHDRTRVRNDPNARAFEVAYDKAAGYRGAVSNMRFPDDNHVEFQFDVDAAEAHPPRWGQNALRKAGRLVLWGEERLPVTANSAYTGNNRQYTIRMRAPISSQGEAWVLDGWGPWPPGVPGPPWPGNATVNGASNSTLTWNELLAVINATGGFRISPGVIQTLISTAIEMTNWISAVAPTVYADVGVPAPPGQANPGGYLNDWLLQPVHSILVGTAYVRYCYNQAATGFDPPLIGSAYNAGFKNGYPHPKPNTLWGMRYHDAYVERLGPHHNSILEYFDGTTPAIPNIAPGPPGTMPQVRFRP